MLILFIRNVMQLDLKKLRLFTYHYALLNFRDSVAGTSITVLKLKKVITFIRMELRELETGVDVVISGAFPRTLPPSVHVAFVNISQFNYSCSRAA